MRCPFCGHLKTATKQISQIRRAHGVKLDTYENVPTTARRDVRASLGLNGNQTVVMYAGSHGPLYSLDTLIDIAEELRDRNDIQFISIGEGWERQRLTQEVKQRGLTNIRFQGPVPSCEVPAYLSAADIACSLVNTKSLTGWNEKTSGTFPEIAFVQWNEVVFEKTRAVAPQSRTTASQLEAVAGTRDSELNFVRTQWIRVAHDAWPT